MQARPSTHPSPELLRTLASSQFDPATVERVLSHLDACSDCRQTARSVLGEDAFQRLFSGRASAATAPSAFGPADTAGTGPAPAPPPVALPISAIFPELRDHPQYEVQRELGRGGMGVVYLARNKLMDRLEVLKVVGKQLLGQPGAAERFLREIRSAARLNHPNIVTAHSAFQAGELLVFAMEYVAGENLGQVVRAHGKLPVANACYYVQQVARGLQHAFEAGMVHRDIKPHNLILVRSAKKHMVKILDFGLAKATREGEEADRGLTGTGAMLGTPDYIAPEQTLDAARADIRADIYSLGCTLYFLLTGSPPFQAGSQYELLQAHHMKEPTPLNHLRSDVPPELAAVASKMMAKDPARRYQTPAEVVQALTPFLKPVARAQPADTDRGGRSTAAPRPAFPGTLIEGQATIDRAARAPKPTAAGPTRQSASLVNQPAAAPEAGWSLMADSTMAPKPPPANPPAAPMAQGTVIEGSVPVATGAQPANALQARPAGFKLPKKWLVVAGAGMAGLLLIVLLVVLVTRPGPGSDPGAEQAKQPKQSLHTVFIDEDFRTAFEKKLNLPEGWHDIPTNTCRIAQVHNQPCLEVDKSAIKDYDAHPLVTVNLPPVKLSGNFFIEGTCVIDEGQSLHFGSDGDNIGGPWLSVTIDYAGAVSFVRGFKDPPDVHQPPPSYKPGLPTKFLLTRKGDLVSVELNNEVAAAKHLGAVNHHSRLHVMLSAQRGGRGSRLYRLKVGTLPP
jgi:serine/threonine protein kinase